MSLKLRIFFVLIVAVGGISAVNAQEEREAPDHVKVFISDFGVEQDDLLEPPPMIGNAKGTIPELLDQLRDEDDMGGTGIAAMTLAGKGESALPAIVERLASIDPAKEPYYFDSLIQVLSRIKSSERDIAFVEQLDIYMVDGYSTDSALLDDSAGTMIMALADSSTTMAMPVLWKMTMLEEASPRARSKARLALDQIGVANPRLDGRSRIAYEDNGEALLNAHPSQKHILLSLLNRELLQTGDVRHAAGDANNALLRDGLTVSNVKTNEKGHIVVEGGYEQTYGWNLEVRMTAPNQAAVVYRYFCGEGCGGSHAGLLERVNNQWLVKYWKELGTL